MTWVPCRRSASLVNGEHCSLNVASRKQVEATATPFCSSYDHSLVQSYDDRGHVCCNLDLSSTCMANMARQDIICIIISNSNPQNPCHSL